MEMAKHPNLRNRDIPFIILANKQDLPGRIDEEELKLIVQLNSLKSVSKLNWYVKNTIGVAGQGVSECFQIFEGQD
jgi:signal recognition particle receptor subunit beta